MKKDLLPDWCQSGSQFEKNEETSPWDQQALWFTPLGPASQHRSPIFPLELVQPAGSPPALELMLDHEPPANSAE